MSGIFVSDEDYFVIKLYKSLPSSLRKSTYDQIQKLFDKYKYQYEFKREDIEIFFSVKKSRASEIIALLFDNGLIEQSNPTKYKFKK